MSFCEVDYIKERVGERLVRFEARYKLIESEVSLLEIHETGVLRLDQRRTGVIDVYIGSS